MKKTFFTIFSLFIAIWAVFAYSTEQASPEVQKIDREINRLEEMKKGYEARALRHENQAERLQFDDQAALETRRHNQIAEENRKKADVLQKEIDSLKEKKENLKKK